MRTFIVCLLVAALKIAAFAEEPAKLPLEGSWELVSAKWPQGNLPGEYSGAVLKIYSSGNFVFVGRTSDKSGAVQERYGGGTYALRGEDYSETITYHVVQRLVGKTVRFHVVVQGDTMTLTGPVVGEGEKDPGFRLVEVYKRKD
jgi:hypothetical protein